MMKCILVAAFLIIVVVDTRAQSTPEDSVKSTINEMFEAMKNADSTALRNVFADSAILQSITRGTEGKTIIRNEPLQEFIHAIARQPAGTADERVQFDIIKVDGPLAIAWTPYAFYFKGELHHCGINSFQLVRTGTTWKIQYIIDTRRTDNCP